MGGLLLAASRQPAQAGRDVYGLGDGHNGALTVGTTNVVINSYAQVTAPVAVGATTLTVASSMGFATGDLVMIWQPTGLTPVPAAGGATSVDLTGTPVGRWELVRLTAVGATSLTLSAPMLYAYTTNLTQVVRVPEYTTVTINAGRSLTATAWNGSTGGILAFLANGTFTNNGVPGLTVSGKGFRGGQVVNDNTGSTNAIGLDEAAPAGAQKGEGIVPSRYGPANTGWGRVANAPGGGVAYLAGGGGGGNAGQGGQGGYSADGARSVGGQGGAALLRPDIQRLLLGGGGGAAHMANSTAGAAGAGGGIIFVRCNSLTGSGSMQANGAAAANTAGTDAASGGGAGGTLYLRVAGSATFGSVTAVGGNGGSSNSGFDVGPGGSGGGGFIIFQKGSGTGAITSVATNPGAAGVQGDSGVPNFGATQGTAGTTTNLNGGFPILPAPVVTTPANGAATNNARPVLSGTLATTVPAGTTVVLVLDGTDYATVTADAAGNYTYTPPSNLTTGAHSLRARAESPSNFVASVDSNTNTFTIDATPPTVVISSTASSPTTATPIPITVTFSESVTGFSAASVAITNGTPSGFAGSGNSYTFGVTPTAPGTVTIALAAGQALDAAGNGNVAATPFSIVFQAPAPAISSIAPAAGGLGQTITLTGSNFSGLNALTINGANALGNIISNTGNSLVVRVPATAAASGTISLGTPTGTIVSSTFGLLSAPGNTLDFDGIDDYVSTPGQAPDFGTGPFTLEAWVRTTGTTQAAAVGAAGGSDYWLGLYQSQATFVVGGQRVQGSSTINDGRWHHLAGVRTSATQLALYVDGVLQNTLTVAASLAASPTSYLAIGRYGNAATPYPWAGRLDEVRLWNVARTAAQLRATLTQPLAGTEPGLVLYHNFDQGNSAGSNAAFPTLYDLVSGQAATLNNVGLSGSSSNFVSSYALVVPTATASTARSATGFTANWTAPAVGTVTDYVLEVATTADFSTPVAGSPFTVAAPATSLAISGLNANSPYYYRVRALNSALLSRGAAATPADQGAYSNTVSQSTPLPVELSAFTATADNEQVRLAWTTVSEHNSARFEVERSLDGSVFGRIGTVAAAGTSSSLRRYGFDDTQAHKAAGAQGLLYYRLKQVDLDGTFGYSPVRAVAVRGAAADGPTLAPNPGRLSTLAGVAAGTAVRVYDALGRLALATTTDAGGRATLALPAGLPAGVYTVRVGTAALRLAVE